MGDLTRSKDIQNNMSDSRQLTSLVKELQNAIRNVKSVEDYLTRVSQAKTLLGKDVGPLSDEIDKNKTQLNDSLIQMGKFVSDVLDH